MLEKCAVLLKTKAVMTVAAFVFIVAVSTIRATYFPEADIFWGARNGMDTLRTGIHIFQPDTWNLLTLSEEWSPNSWLWNVLLGGSYSLFGNYGFLLLTLVANVAAYSFLWGYLQKLRMAPLTAFLVLIGCWFVMNMFMNGRSNTADFLILTAFLYLCRQILHKRVLWLVSSFLLAVLWINLHMTGVAAVVVFPAVVYAMLYEESVRQRLFRSSHVLLSTLPALVMTPYGVEGLVKVSLVKNESKGLITEWSNVFLLPGLANLGILFLLVAALGLMFFMFKRRQWLYGLLTIALIYGTYDTIRLTPFLLTIVLAALVFLEDYYGVPLSLHPRMKGIPELLAGLLLIATLVMAVLSGINLGRAIQDSESMFPVTPTELSLIPENARVVVTQDVGSAIILFRPDVLVTLDGRNDLIGRDRFIDASNILYSENSAEVATWLQVHDIDAVFIENRSAIGTDRIQTNMQVLGWDVRTNGTDAIVYLNNK